MKCRTNDVFSRSVGQMMCSTNEANVGQIMFSTSLTKINTNKNNNNYDKQDSNGTFFRISLVVLFCGLNLKWAAKERTQRRI